MRIKDVRHEIARILTIVRQREMERQAADVEAS
jgi:ribosomal protein L29